MRPPWKLKVGLALGGGAARGLAHVGVLRALVREGIPIDLIAGTSMGAIVGGAYAATGDIAVVEQRVREVLTGDAFERNRLAFLSESKRRRGRLLYSVGNLVKRGIVYGMSTLRPSFLSAERFAATMAAMLPDVRIEECRTPFAAVAVDLEDGREVVLGHGSLRKAVTASSAIPGILPPVTIDGRVLIDGGWIDKMPVLPAYRMGADVVVAVDISADLEDTRDYRRGIDVMLRANAIKDSVLMGYTRVLADVVIEPDVKATHWADFSDVDRSIAAGDEAASNALPQIREVVRQERWRSLVRPRLGKRLAELYLRSDAMSLCVE